MRQMHVLDLTEQKQIYLLAAGVKDNTFFPLVLASGKEIVPKFLDHIRRITGDRIINPTSTLWKNKKVTSQVSAKKENTNESEIVFYKCRRRGHRAHQCRDNEVTCFKCNQKGHFSAQCITNPRETEKEQRRMVNLI